MKNIKWFILIAVAVLLLVSPCVNAEYVTDQKETLRGIEGVYVLVFIEPLESIKDLGLTNDVFQTDIELKLRLAGIKILSKEECDKNLPRPYLCLHITTIQHSSGDWISGNIELRVEQMVEILTKKKIYTHPATWSRSVMGLGGREGIVEYYRSTTKDLVDEFLNDYLAVNPRQVDKPKKK